MTKGERMMKGSIPKAVAACLLLAMAPAACLDAAPVAGDDVVLQQSAVLGTDEFLYFRSNATDWGVDDATRMVPFAGPNVFSLVYSVTQSWMITGNDTAIVTRTNQRNGWGTSQIFYGASPKPVVVPGTAPLIAQSPGGDAHFGVDYSVLGTHRVIVNFAATPPTIQIDSQASACSGVCPAGLTCSLILPSGIPTCSEPPPTGP